MPLSARRLAVALAVLTWLTAGSTRAAGKRPAPGHGATARQEKEARAHFDKAERAFNLGRFEEALAEYEAAYEALPLPAFVFNIAQCHRNMGNGEQAVFFYQRYLALQPDASNRAVVEDLISEEKRRLEESAAAEAAAQAESPVPPADDRANRVDLSPRAADSDRTRGGFPSAKPSSVHALSGAGAPAAPLSTVAAAPARPRVSPRWWLFGGLGIAILGGVALLVLRGAGSLPTGQLGAIDARR